MTPQSRRVLIFPTPQRPNLERYEGRSNDHVLRFALFMFGCALLVAVVSESLNRMGR